MKSSDLRLQSIELRKFRSYDHLLLTDFGDSTLIVGHNAVGKTNIIEAIQMVTALQSFRSHKTSEMIEWGSNTGSVEAKIVGNGRDLDLGLSMTQSRRLYSLNGKRRPIYNLQGLLPAVLFCPDDLQLVKSSDSVRREAIDAIACQLSKNYARVRHDYYSLIRQKNKALKDEVPDDYIRSINDVLVRIGLQYVRLRTVMVEKVRAYLNGYYERISNEKSNLDLVYVPSWAADDMATEYEFDKDEDRKAFEHALDDALPEERHRKHCIVGPQSDTLKFFLNGHDAARFASQGQQRSIVLAYKFSEVRSIQETLGQKPLLLLDDVMSELDSERRYQLINFATQDIQTFITATSLDIVPQAVVDSSQYMRLPLDGDRWTGNLKGGQDAEGR